MTDEQNIQSETEYNDDDPNREADEQTSSIDDDFDVESALAAVASLENLIREPDVPEASPDPDAEDEQEPEKDVGTETIDFVERDAVQEATSRSVEYDAILQDAPQSDLDDSPPPDADALDVLFDQQPQSVFPHPPTSELNRGTLASILPAALLMGVGGLLTFVLTTSDEPISLALLGTFAVGGLGVMLLANWLSTARWAMGSFFIGMTLLLLAATNAYLLLPTNLTFAQGYPLLLTALGFAFVLTDLLTAIRNRVWLIGLLLGIGGVVGVVFTADVVADDLAAQLLSFWYVPIIVLVLILLAPLLRQRGETAQDE